MTSMQEPVWFEVVGGPPPSEVVLRDLLLTLLIPLLALLLGLWLPAPWRLALTLATLLLSAAVFLTLRQRWRRNQQVRIFGNVLEHRDGERLVRVALTRAVLATAAAPPGMLVLMLDDGCSNVTVARRANAHELSDLPPCFGPYLELLPEDFEAVRHAAHRSYPQA